MSLEVLNTPLLATIQDCGRFGYKYLGISQSGVMDNYAYKIANYLLGNCEDTNVLEVLFGKVQFKITSDSYIAITGAQCEVSLNDSSIQMWQTIKVKKGDILKLGKIVSGNYLYLGVKNGFILEKSLGSYSRTLKENIGRAKLQKGDSLLFNTCFKLPIKKLQEKYIPSYDKELTLRVVLSYQESSFSNKEKEKFFSNEYRVTNEISRMGYKLNGEAINCTKDGIISEGIAFGSIQIPKDGQPIVLLKEAQTIGGYPKLGVVLDVDCYKLAQARPNTIIRFKQISMGEAELISKKFYQI